MPKYMLELLSKGTHDSYGWLRRADKDRPYSFAYEHPSGRLIYSSNPRHSRRMTIYNLRDVNTGEEYVTFDERVIAEIVEAKEKRPEQGA